MFSSSNFFSISNWAAAVCDGVGNQQLAPEGSTEGMGSLYKASYGFCDVRNWKEKWREREREREREKIGQWELN